MGDSDTAPVPHYVRIADWLRQHIDSGELAPLARVPSEVELTRQFSVSRETVRSAMDRLVTDGYLFRRAGKGTFVAARRIEHTGSTQTSLSATLDCAGFVHSTRVLTARLMPADHHVARALRLSAGSTVVCIRRLRLVQGDAVALHTTCLAEAYRDILEQDLTGSLQALLTAVGVPIVTSRDTLQAVHADADEARLLGISAGSPLLRLEGVGLDHYGRPLRHTDSLHRGDRFQISHDTQGPSGIRWEMKPETRRSAASEHDDQAVGGRA
jgi:GntR family transcriptional regulator